MIYLGILFFGLLIVAVIKFIGSDDAVDGPSNKKPFSLTATTNDGLTFEEAKDAVGLLLHPAFRSNFSEGQALASLERIAEYRKMAEAQNDPVLTRAYNEWLDYHEKSAKDDIEWYRSEARNRNNLSRVRLK